MAAEVGVDGEIGGEGFTCGECRDRQVATEMRLLRQEVRELKA